MKKITLLFAALAIAFSASAQTFIDQVDVPAGHTGDVQVLMADGVATSLYAGAAVHFVTNPGGWADLGPTGDFVLRAGARDLYNPEAGTGTPGVVNVTSAYVYTVIKVRLAPGATFNPDWALAISDNPWPAANKSAWSDWTDGVNSVPAITSEWQNIVFSGYTATDWAWLSIGMESWVNGLIQIEDVWVTTARPDWSGVDIPSVNADKKVVSVEVFSLTGNRLPYDASGLVIVRTVFSDGSTSVVKEMRQ